ncbi:MAG TPA: xanthine dehydrogenase family protein molybdopterin-binding subunit [Gemmatimonadaceae bacterium]
MIGDPINRVDGPLKVTGRATYAGEYWDVGQPLYGYIVGATIGRGRIGSIDTEGAEKAPGVRLVMTHRNAPKQGQPDLSVESEYSRALPMLRGPEVQHFGDPVAFVVAETFEQARAAANMVRVEYSAVSGDFDFAARLEENYAPKVVNAELPTDTSVGDIEEGMRNAAVTIDQVYTTPYQFSQAMETHTCMATWDGDHLTAYFSSQIISEALTAISSTVGIDKKNIHLISAYVGGGFGSKLGIHAETILAVLAAREVKQPVKVTLTRQQVFSNVGLRPATHQRVRLGADRNGRLVAIGHEVIMPTSPFWEYAEQTAATTRSLYAAPNRLTRHRLTKLDLPRGEDVRAPGDAPGLLAVEAAMDELADALDMDPVELRILNEPKLDPERGVPFSDRRLLDCLREGSRRFGWERRRARPASVREGRVLVGYGMSAGIRGHFQMPAKARVRMMPDGFAVVEMDMTDIGTGTYTVVTQVAAEALELPVDRVRVELGNSNYPPSAGSGGSWGASNSAIAVHRACIALRERLDGSPGIPPEGVEAEGECVIMKAEPNYQANSINTYGAFFTEVGVDVDTAEIRLRRMLGVFCAGRIMNAKTARSQLIGAMIFGLGNALHEEGVLDLRSGAFANRDFAQYLLPVHADVPNVDAVILDGYDDKANILGVKGLGELGVCGAGASVANAVFNATGVRVREYPITIEKVLPGLKDVVRSAEAIVERQPATTKPFGGRRGKS